MTLTPFKSLIKQRCGLLFEGNNEAKLAQALAERSGVLKVGHAEYFAHLQRSDAEFQELVNLLTINETYFFREPEQLRLLVERMVPRLLARSDGRGPLRILSAGCSSGEEPYSLVMSLREKYGDDIARRFEVHGGDIDSTVLAKARHGRYTEFSFRGLPTATRDRYFDRGEWGYILKESVRRQVEFHELNLLSENLPAVLHGFDVILFRNVSIYFDEPTRKFIQQNLSLLLKEDGFLITGTAETLANDFGVLSLVEEEGLFYFVKGEPPLAAKAAPQPPKLTALPQPPKLTALPQPPQPPRPDWSAPRIVRPEPPPPAARQAASPPAIGLDDIGQMAREKRYDEALPLLEQRLAVDARDSGALLLKAHILLNRKDFAAVDDLAEAVIENDPWSVDALLLLGLAAKWRDQAAAAIGRFKQAVYARHECWPAHYYLADLYRNTDAPDLARREYRIVLQLLAGAPDTGVRVVPLDLPAGEIRFLCEHQLARLESRGKPVATR